MAAVGSIGVLVAVLAFAVARPRGLAEFVLAAPAAVLVVLTGLVPARAAWAELIALAPTVGFLAAVLMLAWLCDREGVFSYVAARAGQAARGSSSRLLGLVFVVAAGVTAVLSLDATVVLLTPAVLLTSQRLAARPRPYVYACAHLANSASLLLPVSNLTNLLAFRATGLSFAGFAAAMALPWLVAIGLEYAVFRRFFARDLTTPLEPAAPLGPVPRFAFIVLALTLVGFVVSGPFGVPPVAAAAAGVVALAVGQLARGKSDGFGRGLVGAAQPGFCLFVFALGVVVLAVRYSSLGTALAHVVGPTGSLGGLLLIAVIAAVLANLVNNIPATLVLVPLVAGSPLPVLAVLLGVNIGPNLTYAGSLATLLWRRILDAGRQVPDAGEFVRLGLLTVPVCLVAAVLALWFTHTWWPQT